jgi:transcription antitermination factor NusG
MSALSNVNTRGDGAASPGGGFASISTPELKSLQTGESVRYALNPEKSWHVLRATYGRAKQVYDYITQDGVDSDAYIAMHYVKKRKNGKTRRIKKPLIPGILFVYCTDSIIETYVKDTPAIHFVRYYYNHLIHYPDGTNPPLKVTYPQMMNFIKATSIDDDNIQVIDERFVKYQSGDLVKIVEGKFAGVVGRVARAAGQQRVIINLDGVALIATAYIPTAFLEKIDN